MVKKRKYKRKKKDNYWKIVVPILVLLFLGSIIFVAIKFPDLIPQITLNIPAISSSNFDNLNPSPTCSFDLSKSVACVDENVVGTLTNGFGATCSVFFNYNSGEWQFVRNVLLDSSGKFSSTESASIPGTYIFAAICQEVDGTLCRTNDERIIINDCDAPEIDCSDTDGGDNKDMAGHITFGSDVFYDYCLEDDPVYDLFEYYCTSGDWHGHKVHCDSDQTCIQTRSGGYCLDDAPTYEVGDIIHSGSGSGTSTGTDAFDIINLEAGDNPCTLGIRINAKWDSWNDGNYPAVDGNCFNQNYQEWQHIFWSFQDSTALRWSDVTFAPPVQTLSTDICPAYWTADGTPWQIQIQPAYSYYDFPEICEIKYSYSWEVYNCECP